MWWLLTWRSLAEFASFEPELRQTSIDETDSFATRVGIPPLVTLKVAAICPRLIRRRTQFCLWQRRRRKCSQFFSLIAKAILSRRVYINTEGGLIHTTRYPRTL